MSKPQNQTLIFPGEVGWEVWTRQNDGAFECRHTTALQHAAELEDLPQGELVMAFAARSCTAVPMRVMTTDEALFDDLVILHAERLGLKPDPMAGQLTDVFPVLTEGESSVVLSVFLKPPGENGLPVRGPSAFDISGRCLPVEGDAVCLWREFGRWVIGVHQAGRLVFFQATTVDSQDPGSALVRELKLSMMQLSLQGLQLKPRRIDVWTADGTADVSTLAAEVDLPVSVKPRPVPVLPETSSRLLPEDVRAARQQARKRRTMVMGAAAAILAYLGLVGWLGFGLWSESREIDEMMRQAQAAAPEGEQYAVHIAKWKELSDAIELDRRPVELLYRIATCIPKQKVRLKSADVSAYGITLVGEAPEHSPINSFSAQLIKHNGLNQFEWQTPDPEPPGTSGAWKFRYRGEPLVAQDAQ